MPAERDDAESGRPLVRAGSALRHRCLAPRLLSIAVPIAQQSGDHIVTVGEDVGVHLDRFADGAFDCESTAVDGGSDSLNDDAPGQRLRDRARRCWWTCRLRFPALASLDRHLPTVRVLQLVRPAAARSAVVRSAVVWPAAVRPAAVPPAQSRGAQFRSRCGGAPEAAASSGTARAIGPGGDTVRLLCKDARWSGWRSCR